MITEQEIKETIDKNCFCRLEQCSAFKTCSQCGLNEGVAHELYTNLNQPAPENLREEIAKFIAVIRGLSLWEYLPVKQTPITGCACKEACYREADSILSLIQPEVEKAREEGRREVVEWVKAHGIIAVATKFLEMEKWKAQLKEWGLEKSIERAKKHFSCLPEPEEKS